MNFKIFLLDSWFSWKNFCSCVNFVYSSEKNSMIIYNFYKILWFFRIKLIINVYFKTGHYMFTESSAPRRPGDKARLLSPQYPATNGQCLTFWYHMYGSSIGTLNVYTSSFNKLSPALFTISGDQGNQWRKAQMTIQVQEQYKVRKSGLHLTKNKFVKDRKGGFLPFQYSWL